MSVSVKHLNADTTFLITFSSEDASSGGHIGKEEHRFTILVDPWLAGSSSIWMPRFQISHHTTASVVESLTDLPLPDLILISQDKPDHCHEETLRTLPADTHVHIVAVPAAAKKIKSWRYFTNATITTVNPYRSRTPDTVLRIRLPTKDALFGASGELTISHIPQSFDMTNLHSAIGITYTAPQSSPLLDHEGHHVTLPPSPPITPVMSRTNSDPPPGEPAMTSNVFPTKTSQRPISLLYTPHGIGTPCITPYMESHLRPMGALPLTIFFHAINVEENPWFLGGRVATGLPGGSEVVKRFGAKYWLSAHDEAKDNRGWATAMIKSRNYTLEEAQILCDDEVERWEESQGRNGEGVGPRLVNLGVGEILRA
ncbi:hypothetical protein CAC42_6913 [Sphaceloma murrayae]|uniref:Metallo-beta-lactamase domain-containing protein n=1 Tax=Sphaceloma murrayae TaxID=2082308 RepID=A0A2K1QQM1_9PEZI|nr:hypothetical protein CAC42_6913 [Sphaceloma murrayae]